MLHAFRNSSLFQISRRKGYRVWFFATLLILGAAAWSNALVFQSLSSNLDSQAKNQKIMEAALDVYSSALDIETGQRDFLATGQDQFLELISNGSAQFQTAIQNFGDALGDGPDARVAVDELHSLARRRLDLANRAIAFNRGLGSNDAVQLSIEDQGKNTMDQIRVRLGSVRNNLDASIHSGAATLTSLSWVRTIFSVDCVLGITMLVIGFSILRHGNWRREVAENALLQANEDLEKRVTERTNELAGMKAALEVRAGDLVRSNEDLEQFAYAASHDLQEPLRAMTGGAQALARKYRGKLDQRGDELIEMIVDGSARMKALIEGLLAYSRAGQHDTLETVDTNAALQKVLVDLTLARSESKAEISSRGLPALNFVKGEFERLLYNLVGNAIKYRGPEIPKIHVGAERQMNAWIFKVADNGVGFEPEYADKIFCVFQRLHTGEEYLGTGIGLAIVKKIVERRGGWIWVDSFPGQGSTFFFSVPDEYGKWEGLPA